MSGPVLLSALGTALQPSKARTLLPQALTAPTSPTDGNRDCSSPGTGQPRALPAWMGQKGRERGALGSLERGASEAAPAHPGQVTLSHQHGRYGPGQARSPRASPCATQAPGSPGWPRRSSTDAGRRQSLGRKLRGSPALSPRGADGNLQTLREEGKLLQGRNPAPTEPQAAYRSWPSWPPGSRAQ